MNDLVQTIRVKDGRELGFAQYGDLKGKPLFYFHGWPGSRLAAKKKDVLAKKLGIHIISPDRPGYGISDFQKDRTLLDWPGDVVAIANFLRIKKFAILGVSGGGPYAAVCAYKIPHRLMRIGIVVGLAPTNVPGILDDLKFLVRLGWKNYDKQFVRNAGTLFHYVNARYGPRLGLHRFFFGAKADKQLYQNKMFRDAVAQSTHEAFRQGYHGPLHDLKIYSDAWGFELSEIRVKSILWYGQDDQSIPISMGKYYSTQLLKNTFTIYPGEGHFVAVSHFEEILKTLTE